MTTKLVIIIGTLSGWLLLLLFFLHQKQSVEFAAPEKGKPYKALQTREEATTQRPNPIPRDEVLKKMSDKELELLFHRYISSPQATCSSVERMGRILDGGWELCLDPRYAPDSSNCLVYSFGINYEFSFDDAMAAYGCEVHSFDPSMGKSKDHLRGKRVHFHLEGIGGEDGPSKRHSGKWAIYTLNTFRNRLEHPVGKRRVDVLKMDVEGAEIASLRLALKDGSMSDIPQVCFEMHGQSSRQIILQHLPILRESYDIGLRIYMTNRNLHCLYESPHTGLKRTKCHEIYMVNVKLARK